MKTYEVTLTKSYIVRIEAENSDYAKEFSQIYTGDIKDISTMEEREKLNFNIENIECKLNQVFEIREINEND